MSDRAVDSHEGATVCPFVAFVEDRDRRATDPDHRHRCYAEPVPAPRAIAHQRRYCLSPEFPSCPTFQDWAVRAAASGTSLPTARIVSVSASSDDLAGSASGSGPRRIRDWAAPPPWVTEAAAAKRGDQLTAFDDPDEESDAPFAAPNPRAPSEVGSPSRPAPLPADPRAVWPIAPDVRGRGQPEAERPPSGRGFAYDLIAGDPDFQESPSTANGSAGAGQPAGGSPTPWSRSDGSSQPGGVPRPSRRPAASTLPEPEYLPPVRRMATRLGHLARNSRSDGSREWDKPRSFEAYPSLRTRVGLPGLSSLGRLPPVAVGVIALVLAAGVLFLLPGIFAGGPGASETPRATRTVRPTVTVVPTTEAPPTPLTYTVKRGDTLSKIAKDFAVTVAQLLAANPQVTNANALKIGQVLNIPTRDASAAPSDTGVPTELPSDTAPP